MSKAFDWANRSGDSWAERWRETDRGLSGLERHLDSAILAGAPPGAFRAFDVGCGPGSTTLALVQARPDATIIACDLSPALAEVARQRLGGHAAVEIVLGDARQVALETAPFDLIYSRHGVMFFDDPYAAFAGLRAAASGRGKLVFSCFRDWAQNRWASQLACAAAGRTLPPPGREPSGFAFADTEYVRDILQSAGWRAVEAKPVLFDYLAGEGENAVGQALAFLSEIGPASAVLRELAGSERGSAIARMRSVIEAHVDGNAVRFEAAAWIWTASASEP